MQPHVTSSSWTVEESAIDDVVYANLAITALPHRDPNRDGGPAIWRQTRNGILYEFSSGKYSNGTLIGIPFGSKARIILLSCLTEALRNASPVVPMGETSYSWIREMNGHSIGGKTYKLMSEQAFRIDACSVRVAPADARLKIKNEYLGPHPLISAADTILRDSIVENPRFLDPDPWHYRGKKFANKLPDSVLGKGFYESYGTSPIRISRAALRQIANNCTAIDLYIWLSGELPKLTQPRFVSWSELADIFGSGYKQLKHLRPALVETLDRIKEIYPGIRIDISADGWLLHAAPAPIGNERD